MKYQIMVNMELTRPLTAIEKVAMVREIVIYLKLCGFRDIKISKLLTSDLPLPVRPTFGIAKAVRIVLMSVLMTIALREMGCGKPRNGTRFFVPALRIGEEVARNINWR